RVLIQGPSGSGKSTLLELLLGFVPYQGSLKVNGRELAELERSAWQARIGYLAQQPQLLAASVADNLRLAAPGATERQLWGVLGGRRRRGRRLLRDSALRLRDEPLAHLDPDTAEQMGVLIDRLSQGRTLLLVSHERTGLDWLTQVLEVARPVEASA